MIAESLTGLSGIKTALEIAKAIKESDFSLEKAEMKFRFADLMIALSDVKIEMAQKDELIAELRSKISKKQMMTFEAPFYYCYDDSENKDGPFCQACYDKDGKSIRVYKRGSNGFVCKCCTNVFYQDENAIRSAGSSLTSKANGLDVF